MKTGDVVSLTPRFVVGRSEGCQLQLEDRRVSAEHASIYYNDGQWSVRDLASRNGTQVNDTPLNAREPKAILAGDIITFGTENERWVLVDAGPPAGEEIAATEQAKPKLEDAALRFVVSADEEDLSVYLSTQQLEHQLPPRAFMYLLLTLARARSTDIIEHTPEDEQGWLYTEDLVPSLYPDNETLNVAIHRCRQLIRRFGIEDSSNIVERRARSKRLRIGVRALEIIRTVDESSTTSREL